jgi:hypothetical protein
VWTEFLMVVAFTHEDPVIRTNQSNSGTARALFAYFESRLNPECTRDAILGNPSSSLAAEHKNEVEG